MSNKNRKSISVFHYYYLASKLTIQGIFLKYLYYCAVLRLTNCSHEESLIFCCFATICAWRPVCRTAKLQTKLPPRVKLLRLETFIMKGLIHGDSVFFKAF